MWTNLLVSTLCAAAPDSFFPGLALGASFFLLDAERGGQEAACSLGRPGLLGRSPGSQRSSGLHSFCLSLMLSISYDKTSPILTGKWKMTIQFPNVALWAISRRPPDWGTLSYEPLKRNKVVFVLAATLLGHSIP